MGGLHFAWITMTLTCSSNSPGCRLKLFMSRLQFSMISSSQSSRSDLSCLGFSFCFDQGEVLSSLLHKIRHASPKRFACLVAVPDCPQNEQNKVVGVVDAAAMADQHVLRCLPGAVDEYLYLSGMAVDSNYRRQKVATVLLEACDLTAMEWGFEYLVLQAYEDDRAARLLYARAGYTIISMDPLWLSQWLGRRRRLILAKRASLIVT
eukprot:c13028_g1_i1 orf=386-1006(+)